MNWRASWLLVVAYLSLGSARSESTSGVLPAVVRWNRPRPAVVGTGGWRKAEDIMGKKAPDFELKDVNGESVSRDDLKGKVVILDFWAVWCGPCQRSLPFLQSLSEKYGSRGLKVVGLHVDDRMPSTDEIKQYLEDRQVDYTHLVSTWEVDEAFLIYAMPTTYLLDREGRVQKRHIGFNPAETPERLEKDVLEVLEQ